MSGYECHIVNPEIEKYLDNLISEQDPILLEMERKACEIDFPIIGPQVGRLLYQITMISGAQKIFELGSGFGYSAFWFAKALGNKGSIFCTDKSDTNYDIYMEFSSRCRLTSNIRYEVGESLQILNNQSEKYDIILNDIDKEDYPDVIEVAKDRLVKGGILITDNILWFGRVISSDQSPSTEGVKEFTEKILSSDAFCTSIIPIRDGISLSIRV